MKNLHILKKLRPFLPAERFIIGGSNAIRLHGISLPKEPEDLDIILEKPTSQAIANLERMQSENPNPRFSGKASMAYSFYMDDVKCDVWIKNELSVHPLTSYEGILVNSIADIVDYKKKFNRAKDWIQLMQWSLAIFDKKQFEMELMDIGSDPEYDLNMLEEPERKTYDPLTADQWEDDLPF